MRHLAVAAELPSFRLADYVLWWTTPEKCGLAARCADCGSRNVRHPAVHACTSERHECNRRGWAEVPSNADVSNARSLDIAREMLVSLGITESRPWAPRQSNAAALEKAVAHFTQADGLTVERNIHLGEFAHYRHLRDRKDDRLRLDVTVSRQGVLLAVLELKATLRSDRGRGAIQNLKTALTQRDGGPVPRVAVVTAEPLPGRLAAAAPRTGDMHAIYHVSRPALAYAVEVTSCGSQLAEWRTAQDHVRDFSELPAFLRQATA